MGTAAEATRGATGAKERMVAGRAATRRDRRTADRNMFAVVFGGEERRIAIELVVVESG